MQLTPSKGNFIEKILRDSSGRLVRATFCVYQCGGRMKARLVGAVEIQEGLNIENKIYALSGLNTEKSIYTTLCFDRNIVSPYFVSNILYSSGSKPRAPTEIRK